MAAILFVLAECIHKRMKCRFIWFIRRWWTIAFQQWTYPRMISTRLKTRWCKASRQRWCITREHPKEYCRDHENLEALVSQFSIRNDGFNRSPVSLCISELAVIRAQNFCWMPVSLDPSCFEVTEPIQYGHNWYDSRTASGNQCKPFHSQYLSTTLGTTSQTIHYSSQKDIRDSALW